VGGKERDVERCNNLLGINTTNRASSGDIDVLLSQVAC